MFKKTKSRPDGNVAPPTQTVQCDWEQRDFTQSITLGLSQLTDFLNNFDVKMRGRLAQLNSRISKVEGQVQLIEQVLESVYQQGAIAERSSI
mmetsp:Transcript_26/g.60  ORF Transcript_26/g.60 Transcript_26/m.60 type:complete len:92 (+) Transcript_26:31-306(+)